jgi:hypothetical protein
MSRLFGVAAAVVATSSILLSASAAYAATTLYVSSTTGADSPTCGSSSDPCRSIGQAVANASPGDTIQVAAGSYAETVVVDKSLTLDGAQAGNPGSAGRLAAPATESVLTTGNIDIEASSVTVDGFSFDNPGNQVCVACAGFSYNSDVTVENNVFSGYKPDSFGPWQVSGPVGVNHTTNTVISRNYFRSPDADLGDSGGATVQWFDGGCSGANVSDNTFDSAEASALSDIYLFCNGVPPDFFGGAEDTTGAITVSGNHDTITGSSDFALFTHIAGGAEVDVTGNTVTMTPASSTGIYFSNSPGLTVINVKSNTLTGSPYRAVKLNTNAHMPAAVTISGNDFSRNGLGLYVGSSSLAAGASVTLRANNLSDETGDDAGDGANGVYNSPSSGAGVDAVDNWWGCNTGPNTAGCSGTLGAVTYDPWLVLAISANPTTVTIGSSSTVTADVTRDSAGNDTSGTGTIPDGTLIAFATDYGVLSANAAGTSGGKTPVTITSSAPGTSNVTATLDNQTVWTTVTFTKPPLPATADQCKKGGWQSYGGIFKNQGDCVSFVATHGKNAP